MYVFKPFVFTECLNPISEARPSPRTFPTIFSDEKYLYSFSGYKYIVNRDTITDYDNPKIIKEIWKYNLSTGVWSCLPKQQYLPTNSEIILGMTFKSDKLIVATWNENQTKGYLYTHHLKDENRVVKIKAKGPIPERSIIHNFVNHGSYLYTIGNNHNLSVYRVDPETAIWEKLTPENGNDFPGYYEDIELAYDGKRIYVLFIKLYEERIREIKTIQAYDVEQNRWYILSTTGDSNNEKPFPDVRTNFGNSSYIDPLTKDVSVIISGGNMNHMIYSDIWQLNLRTLQWTCLNKFGFTLPQPVCEHDALITYKGKMYIFGGRIKNTNDRLMEINTLYSSWLRIPRLTDICWDAVNHYYKDLNTKTDEELFNLGLPVNIVKSRCQ
ncbi:GSCOCG00005647001-RA-CDS [Cotesia congregata]|uniref:Similar to slim: Kelch domain-containing protein 10 homolog (Drosophila melanogaster) n=1 Tax=Cotesia congregata TaxID=51543 RepID=A0A8J2MVT7_COTCN|nr:GSCOCG00005647001-RA-CDS [Cotesia congregata]CAG5099743.1 Similar to slim: Kelch domain-containing protein 10 homolog (Drosophila melanogaster) [Cotesia congregata]